VKNIVAVLLLGCCLGACAPGQSYTINTIAGIYPPGDTGAATTALLASPANIAVDGNGNVYFADSSNHKIRKVTVNGIITSIAGGSDGNAGDNGPALQAQFAFVRSGGPAVDVSGTGTFPTPEIAGYEK
jgi:hypothetical protein